MRATDTISEKRITVQGISTVYFEAGAGPVLLLLHGNVTTPRGWYHTMTNFRSTHRVLAVALPGYGDTGPLPDARPDRFVSFLVAFLDALSLGEVILVGHSSSGLLAAMLALDHPERVARLVLIDSSGLGRAVNPALIGGALLPPPVANALIAALLLPGSGVLRTAWSGLMLSLPWRMTFREWSDQVRKTKVPTLLRTSYELVHLAVGLTGQRSSHRVTDRLGELTMPTLVIWGLTDVVFPFWHGVSAARAIPRSKLVIILGAGHVSHLGSRREFIDAIGPFLRDDLGAPPRTDGARRPPTGEQ